MLFAHPSETFFEKQRFRAEGVRHGTFADAHPPRENLVFTEKLWKGVPKSPPGSSMKKGSYPRWRKWELPEGEGCGGPRRSLLNNIVFLLISISTFSAYCLDMFL